MGFFKQRKIALILLVSAVIFFGIYSWFSFTVISPQAEANEGQRIFSWPDAMATNFFVERFIETGEFQKEEPLNVPLQGIMHPRSTNVLGPDTVPMGFLGMLIIYGWLGKLLGSGAVMYLTAFFAVIGSVAFYGLLRFIFNKNIALLSFFMLLTLAPFWYYANLAMLSTVLFISLVLIGMYLYVKQTAPQKKGFFERFLHFGRNDNGGAGVTFSILSGLFIGFALIVRPIEFIWIGLLIIVPFIFYVKKVRFTQVISFIVALFVPIALMLFYNWQIYGEVFTVGYLRMHDTSLSVLDRLPTEFEKTAAVGWKSYAKLIFLPFGFHPKIILLNLQYYLWEFLWPYLIAFGLALVTWLVYLFRKMTTKAEKVYALTGLLAGAWLIIYYGSWLFVDQLVLKHNTIGSSYIRYWVPLNILLLPAIAYLLNRFLKIKVARAWKIILVAMIVLVLGLYSGLMVYFSKGDGLLDQEKTITHYYEQAEKVESLIEPNAIIVNNRADKLFFPKRQVIMFDLDYSIFPLIAKQVDDIPFYYFSLMPDKDINYINERKIKQHGLKITEPVQIDEQFRLFKLIKK